MRKHCVESECFQFNDCLSQPELIPLGKKLKVKLWNSILLNTQNRSDYTFWESLWSANTWKHRVVRVLRRMIAWYNTFSRAWLFWIPCCFNISRSFMRFCYIDTHEIPGFFLLLKNHNYLHRAQWRYYFHLSRVRILVSPWLLIWFLSSSLEFWLFGLENISIIVFISPL